MAEELGNAQKNRVYVRGSSIRGVTSCVRGNLAVTGQAKPGFIRSQKSYSATRSRVDVLSKPVCQPPSNRMLAHVRCNLSPHQHQHQPNRGIACLGFNHCFLSPLRGNKRHYASWPNFASFNPAREASWRFNPTSAVTIRHDSCGSFWVKNVFRIEDTAV